ncbi:hypothetical protein [Akkermansia sp.]|uniref:hypothetical protein n=1 Tax=Akkermansia sp. TaxID=1872421 RepID=UPI0025B816C2|nr:hypothetical protein [Akkermansia sp.]MCC8147964.1 hypothetical protein [Akkermansia sp.]
MKLTRRQAWALYHKRDRELERVVGAIHPYEVIEDEIVKPDGSKFPTFTIMTSDDTAAVIMNCDKSSDWLIHLSPIAVVRGHAIALAKELSVRYYMEHGDEDMR